MSSLVMVRPAGNRLRLGGRLSPVQLGEDEIGDVGGVPDVEQAGDLRAGRSAGLEDEVVSGGFADLLDDLVDLGEELLGAGHHLPVEFLLPGLEVLERVALERP